MHGYAFVGPAGRCLENVRRGVTSTAVQFAVEPAVSRRAAPVPRDLRLAPGGSGA